VKSIYYKNREIFSGLDLAVMARRGLPKLKDFASVEAALLELFKSFKKA